MFLYDFKDAEGFWVADMAGWCCDEGLTMIGFVALNLLITLCVGAAKSEENIQLNLTSEESYNKS